MVRHQPSAVRRSQILRAAMAVCGEKGYHAARIDDIAQRAGLSKGAVYHHFTSKQEVFLGVMEMILDETIGHLETMEASGMSASDMFQRTAALIIQLNEDNPQLARGLADLYVLGIREGSFQRRFAAYYDRVATVGARIIRTGVERGEISDDINPEKTARAFFMALDGLLFMDLVVGNSAPGRETIETLSHAVSRGLSG